MFRIDGLTGECNLNRGDDCEFTVFINEGTNLSPIQYKLTNKDALYLAIEEPNQPFENAIVKKKITTQNSLMDIDGNIIIKLKPEDTECLMPGLYYYEIKAKLYKENQFRNSYILITFKDNNEYTIINTKDYSLISNGTYTIDENTYTLTTFEGEVFVGNLNGKYLTLPIDSKQPPTILVFEQQESKINTIIPQTRFVIER